MQTNRLRGKIAESGYSQKALAKAMGVSANTLGAKITGKKPFNVIEIEDICRLLNINSIVEKAEIFLSKSSQNRDEC